MRSGTGIGKALVLLLAVSTLILGAVACGGTQQPLDDSAAAEQRTVVRTQHPEIIAEAGGAMAHAGDTEARASNGARARAGDARASTREAVASSQGTTEKGDESKDRARKVTLEVVGDQGIPFSGVCSVGRHEEVLEGRVPERYVYEPGGTKLECEIRKEGAGTPGILVTGEDVRSVQRTNAQGSTVRLALSGGIGSSTSSISQNQTIESSQRSVSDDYP
jgi:hypothetical protein